MKGLAFNQVTRATLLAAGIDGTLTWKLHVIKMDDGDGISMLETSGTLISDGDGESYEGPPALETEMIFKIKFLTQGCRLRSKPVMMTARMTMALNILLILLFPLGC